MYFRSVEIDGVPYEVIGIGDKVEVKGVGKFRLQKGKFSARSMQVVNFVRNKING